MSVTMQAPSALGQPGARPVKVLLADPQPLFRHAIASLLGAEPDFEIAGHAENCLELVEQVQCQSPDLLVLSPELNGLECLETVRRLRAKQPGLRIVLLGEQADDEVLLGAVRLGVNGFLLKDIRPDELFDQLRLVFKGQTPVATPLVGRLVAVLRETGCEPHQLQVTAKLPEESLSRRELEILQLVAHGLSNKEIGRRLCITEGTVKNHVHSSLRKLKMYNRIQAAAYIVRQGLGVPLDD